VILDSGLVPASLLFSSHACHTIPHAADYAAEHFAAAEHLTDSAQEFQQRWGRPPVLMLDPQFQLKPLSHIEQRTDLRCDTTYR
jgi:hypothetical protein